MDEEGSPAPPAAPPAAFWYLWGHSPLVGSSAGLHCAYHASEIPFVFHILSAADPQYMRFTGDGGAMVESNQEKAEQCAAIFLLNPTFNHSSSNNNNNVVVGGSNEPVSGGVSISFAFVASAASLLAPLAFAVVAVLVMY